MFAAGGGRASRRPRYRYGVIFLRIWVPGRMSAPGPGRPVVASIVLVPVAASQKVVTKTPFVLVLG